MRAAQLAVGVVVAAVLAVPPVAVGAQGSAVAAQGVAQQRLVPGPRPGAVAKIAAGTTTLTRVLPGLAALGPNPSLEDIAAAWRSEVRWMAADDVALQESVAAEEEKPFGWVTPVRDLDGDRRRDLVSVRSAGGTLTYRGMKGSTGAVLWRVAEPGSFGLVTPAVVGPDHARGVLLLSIAFDWTQDDNGNGTISSTTTVTAVDAAGSVLWRRSFEGSGQMTDMGAVVQGLAFPAGLGRITADPGTDVLIASSDMAAGPVGGVERMQLMVLDGATGATAMTTESPQAGGFAAVNVVGDLDGDDLQDLVTASTAAGGGVAVTSYRGADGRPIWSRVVQAEFVYHVQDAGDLDGDATSDLLLYGFDEDEFRGLVDAAAGSDGAPLWTAAAEIGVPAGDIDGDGTNDVVLQELIDDFEAGRMGVRYRAVGAGGATLFKRGYTVRLLEGSSMTSMALYGAVGDASGDGRQDLAHEIEQFGFEARTTRFERGVVRSSDGAKALRGSVGFPLYAKVDRKGQDFATTRSRASAVHVRVRDGRTGKELWRRRLPAPNDSFTLATAASVAGDRRAEVFITVNGGRVPRVYALNPRSGALRWKR